MITNPESESWNGRAANGSAKGANPARPSHLAPGRDEVEELHAGGVREGMAGLMETATDAIVVTDAQGRIAFWNAAATREWEWAASEVVEKFLQEKVFADPTQHEDLYEAIAASGQWHGHVMTVSKTGRTRVFLATVSACNGGKQWLMSFRSSRLPGLSPDAAVRLERLEAFAKGIDEAAHDLNNAISPFSMSMGLLHARLQGPGDGPLLELLETATNYAAAVVEELLKASRRATGRGE